MAGNSMTSSFKAFRGLMIGAIGVALAFVGFCSGTLGWPLARVLILIGVLVVLVGFGMHFAIFLERVGRKR